MSQWISWFGTAASIVVAVSLTMKNIKRLRTVNLFGAAAFATYGFLIKAWPVFGLNAFIVAVDLYYLSSMLAEAKKGDVFDVLTVDPCRDDYVRRFLSFHLQDIRRFFPSFDPDPEGPSLAGAEACFILRQTMPVSLVLYRRSRPGAPARSDPRPGAGEPAGAVRDDAGGPDLRTEAGFASAVDRAVGPAQVGIILDYAIPAYRDYKNARFFFGIAAGRIVEGPAVFAARAEVRSHENYLRKLGFKESGRSGRAIDFELELRP